MFAGGKKKKKNDHGVISCPTEVRCACARKTINQVLALQPVELHKAESVLQYTRHVFWSDSPISRSYAAKNPSRLKTKLLELLCATSTHSLLPTDYAGRSRASKPIAKKKKKM